MEQINMAKTSAARIKASDKYNKANMVNLNIRVNLKTDADVVEHLLTIENKRAYILSLIREDIAKQK